MWKMRAHQRQRAKEKRTETIIQTERTNKNDTLYSDECSSLNLYRMCNDDTLSISVMIITTRFTHVCCMYVESGCIHVQIKHALLAMVCVSFRHSKQNETKTK